MRLWKFWHVIALMWLPVAASTARAHSEAPQPATPDTAPSEAWNRPEAKEKDTSATSDESLPAPADSDGDLLVDGIIIDEGAGWYGPRYWFGPLPWDSGIELGINGSSGTSESLSIQSGGYIKRESRFSKLDLDGNYNRTTSGGTQTQNNAQL